MAYQISQGLRCLWDMIEVFMDMIEVFRDMIEDTKCCVNQTYIYILLLHNTQC